MTVIMLSSEAEKLKYRLMLVLLFILVFYDGLLTQNGIYSGIYAGEANLLLSSLIGVVGLEIAFLIRSFFALVMVAFLIVNINEVMKYKKMLGLVLAAYVGISVYHLALYYLYYRQVAVLC